MDGAPDAIAHAGPLLIRQMRDTAEDYELMVTWRNQAHVREWWEPDDPPLTLDGAVAEYGPTLTSGSATTSCVIESLGTPIGFLQFYQWSAHDETALGVDLPHGSWGVDIFIGEESHLNRGFGSRSVALVCDHLFAVRQASAVALGVEIDNKRAQRAYEKAGLHRAQEYLDTDTRNGERVRSYLMIRLRVAP